MFERVGLLMICRENRNGCIFLYLHLAEGESSKDVVSFLVFDFSMRFRERLVYFYYVAEVLFVRDLKVGKL